MVISLFCSTEFFNSHPHKEDDKCAEFLLHIWRFFNSHPHKEDDSIDSRFTVWFYLFNSHPHKEDDRDTTRGNGYTCFSTHILTRRMTAHHLSIRNQNRFFNSHPHKGDDTALAGKVTFLKFFNSHPHKEDDSHSLYCVIADLTFQLTSSQGG